MKKRILCLILTVVMLITSLGVLAACGEDDPGVTPVDPNVGGPHEHSPSANWESNATRHYHSCSGCTEKLDSALHDFTGEDNTVCTVCGYTCEHPEGEGTEYVADPEYHWIPDECGHDVNVDKAPHEFNLDGQCTVCGKFNHEHTFEEEWSYLNESSHWKAPTCGCTASLLKGEYESGSHSDGNADGSCDVCSAKMLARYDIEKKYSNYTWEDTEITICLNEHSNTEQLPSAHRRYLAGEIPQGEKPDTVDDLVATRQQKAYETTHVTVKYEYWGTEDKDTKEEPAMWGTTVSRMTQYALSGSGEIDVFINQIYDMVSAQLNGAFANTRSMIQGDEQNYFSYTDPEFEEYAEQTGNEFGYMLEYMSELSFSKKKQYLVASDYFIDLVRAFFIVPLNIKLLHSIGLDKSPIGDRDGDHDSDVDDFYKMVMNGEWTYNMVAEYSEVIHREYSGATGGSMEDQNGWILSTEDGMYSSALLYTTSIKFFSRELNSDGVYTCTYPKTNEDLGQFCDALASLVGKKGVHVENVTHTEIRDKFTGGQVLFGGVALLGSLELEGYQAMKEGNGGGFGVLPVPLYRQYDIEYDQNGEVISKTQEKYLTIIHNMGRIAAISATTDSFIQCTAYLDYQSTHSSEILNEYYEYNLEYAVAGGTDGNIAILEYIRKNVRSAFDKTYEDAVGYDLKKANKANNSWALIIQRAKYACTTIRGEYWANASAREEYLKQIVNVYTDGTLPE